MNRRPLRFPTVAFVVLLSSTLQLAYGQTTDATAGDPSLSPSNEIVTVAVQAYTVSGLVTRLRQPKAFKYGIAPFSGHPGVDGPTGVSRAPALRRGRGGAADQSCQAFPGHRRTAGNDLSASQARRGIPTAVEFQHLVRNRSER